MGCGGGAGGGVSGVRLGRVPACGWARYGAHVSECASECVIQHLERTWEEEYIVHKWERVVGSSCAPPSTLSVFP